MIWIIVRREILDNLMSMKFLFGTVLCLALIVTSTIVSLQDYQTRMDTYDSTLAELNEQSRYSLVWLLRKPEVLSIFARGFDNRLGSVTMSRPDSGAIPAGSRFMGAQEGRQPAFESMPIDFLFVVRVILSLLAIFLSYDAVSGEYERGTLRLMLSRPVSRASIILGKLIAGLACLLTPLIMSFIIGVLIIQLAGGIEFTWEEWLRIALIFGVSILCVTSFYMMGLVVSCRTHRAATSLLILLLIWIAGVFLIPGVTTAIMDRYRLITPHAGDDIRATYVDFDQNNPRPIYRREMDRETQNRRMLRWEELRDDRNYSIWNLQRQYLSRLYFQADLVRWICRISPTENCAYVSEAMARTDVETYRSFMRYARSYYELHRESYMTFYRDEDAFEAGEDRYSKAIVVSPMDFSESFRSAALDICLLFVFNVLFFMLSVLFFIRYDVH